MAWFIKILFWVNFENVVAHLETNWFNFWRNIITAVFHMAKSLIAGAIEIWESCGPFLSDFLKDIWWDGKLGATCVNDGWVLGVFTRFLHWFGTIKHTLTLKGPCSKPILKVFECLETCGSTDDLGWIITSEKCIWCLTHFLWCDTETDHGSVDNSIIFEWPQIMKLLLFHVFVWWKSENTIWVMTETLWFIQTQKLEEGTFVLFKLKFQLNTSLCSTFQGLDASVILPNETLEFSWAICQLWACFGEDFVWLGLVHVVGHGFASSMHLISLDEATLKRIVLLELIVSCCLVITKYGSNCKVFWTCVKDNSCWLGSRRAHPYSSKINCIISTVKRNLKLQIVFVIDSFISWFTYQLSGVNMSKVSSFIICFVICISNNLIINFIIDCLVLLSQISNMLLSNRFTKLSLLFSSKNWVISLFRINKEICFQQSIFSGINHKSINVNCIRELYSFII